MARVTCDGCGASRFTALRSSVFHQISSSVGRAESPSGVLTSQGPARPLLGWHPLMGRAVSLYPSSSLLCDPGRDLCHHWAPVNASTN